MKKRISIYIDGANFFGGINKINKKYTDEKFDFERYIKKLANNTELIKVYYYNGYSKKKINTSVWKRQDRLFNRLKKLQNWNVILFRKQENYDEEGTKIFKLKEDDIQLAINALSDAYEDKYDKLILISSDRDFIPLIRKIKKLRKEVAICYFKHAISKKLLKLFDKTNQKNITKKIIKRYFYKNN